MRLPLVVTYLCYSRRTLLQPSLSNTTKRLWLRVVLSTSSNSRCSSSSVPHLPTVPRPSSLSLARVPWRWMVLAVILALSIRRSVAAVLITTSALTVGSRVTSSPLMFWQPGFGTRETLFLVLTPPPPSVILFLITPCFKEFYRTNTLSHQCPYTEHAHFNQIEYAMNLLV